MTGHEKLSAAAGGDMDDLRKHNEKLLAFVNDISSSRRRKEMTKHTKEESK